MNFEPNLTSHVQPLDQGIIKCFKAHYRTRYIQRAIDRYDTGITPSEIYNIDQLEAMQLADIAWHEVNASTIQHCWRKAGILPEPLSTQLTPSILISLILNQQDPVIDAEKEVKAALEALVATGVLQSNNRMSIEALLNPQEELLTIKETTDKEIFQAVMDAKKVCEESTYDKGDNDIEDDSPSYIIRPTHNKVLQAALVVKKYIEELNNPFARKLEGIINSFGRQMRLIEAQALKPTVMTDYFIRI